MSGIFTKFYVIISFEPNDKNNEDEPQVFVGEYTLFIQEKEKSHFNPQNTFISKDAKAALNVFLLQEKDRHSGYEADDLEIFTIDDSGDDSFL